MPMPDLFVLFCSVTLRIFFTPCVDASTAGLGIPLRGSVPV